MINKKDFTVRSGLSTAFETTFLALSVALSLQIFATFVRKSEEELLDDISDFCAANVVLKLRVEGRDFAPAAFAKRAAALPPTLDERRYS